MAQDVAELAPRVRRAIEGPKALAATDSGYLTDEQVAVLAADAIGDLILYTVGQWPHTLTKTGTDNTTGVDTFSVDPPLDVPEESLVAAQAALTYFFHDFRDKKVSETIQNEGQSYDYELSANTLRDQFKMLRDQRDLALQSIEALHPVMARAASLFHLLDRQLDAALSGFVRDGGLGGGFELDPATSWPGPLNEVR